MHLVRVDKVQSCPCKCTGPHCKKLIMGLVIFIKKIKVIIKNSEYISLKKL